MIDILFIAFSIWALGFCYFTWHLAFEHLESHDMKIRDVVSIIFLSIIWPSILIDKILYNYDSIGDIVIFKKSSNSTKPINPPKKK